MSKETGKTSLAVLILLLLLAIPGYLCYRIIPVYLEKDAFQEDLISLGGNATRSGWDNRRIIRQLMQMGESRNFTVKEKDIRIQRVRGRSEVAIEVNYSRTEEFPGGYLYVFHFRSATLGTYWF